MEADIVAADRGESVGLMEPMLVGESSPRRGALTDLAIDLAAKSAAFRASVPAPMIKPLADLVRSMNCYYSNLIEGHDTHPVDIERALNGDLSGDARQRDLQLEARAHIAVQSWIDDGNLARRETTAEGLQEVHRRFCELLPEDLLRVEEPDTHVAARVLPGALRTRDVRVGRHVAVSAGAVGRFLARFEQAYARLGRADAILAAPASHHRLLWIHPFLDGNGRVARLMTHALFLRTLDTGALWSIARGLARNEAAYKRHLAACDAPRRNDLDGRGTLSEEALAAFTRFCLEIAIDQVEFMRSLVAPDGLRRRVLHWAEEEVAAGRLPARAGPVLEALLYRGELPRAEIAPMLGATDRHARRLTAALAASGVLASDGPKAPFRLAFPAVLAPRWFPGLFPERPPPVRPRAP